MIFDSMSVDDTIKIGADFVKSLKPADIVALLGDLGSGKTHFVKGMATGLNLSAQEVTSPTFTLFNIYEGSVDLYHFDWYRLKDFDEFVGIGALDYIYGDGISVIEWYDPKIFEIKDLKIVKIENIGYNRRKIHLM